MTSPLFAAALLVLPSAPTSAPPRVDLQRRVEWIVEGALQEGATGVSVVVERDGVVLFARGRGFDGAEPASATSLHPAGALLDAWLACAAVALAQEGRLDLVDPVAKHLPDAGFDQRVRIEHLLSHTAGFADWTELVREEAGALAPRDVVDRVAGRPLAAEPGTTFRFDPANTLTLAALLSRIEGHGAKKIVAERVLRPAGVVGVEGCSVSPEPAARSRVERETPGGVHATTGVPLPLPPEALCVSARDLVRWARALVDGRLVDETWTEALLRERSLSDGAPTGRGLVFDRGRVGDFERLSLGGRVGDSHMHVTHVPLIDAIVAVQARGETVEVDRIAERVCAYLLGLPDELVLDLPTPAETRAACAGYYKIASSAYRVREEGEHLVLHPPRRGTLRLLHQGDRIFLAEGDPSLRLEFHVRDGRAHEFVLVRDGRRTVATRFD